jgi:hypothetical protein
MKYIAKNLEEVAKAMDLKFEQASQWAGAVKSATDKRRAEIEAHVWAQAAQMLRDVELRP